MSAHDLNHPAIVYLQTQLYLQHLANSKPSNDSVAEVRTWFSSILLSKLLICAVQYSLSAYSLRTLLALILQ